MNVKTFDKAFKCHGRNLQRKSYLVSYEIFTSNFLQWNLDLGESLEHVSVTIPRNPEGVPVFPDVDLNKLPLNETRTVLQNYFAVLWGT
jgi:hypothetical protein